MKKNKMSDTEKKTLALELQKEISKLETAVYKLETDIITLQSGDKNGPYWNGSNAYDALSACVGHLEHNKTLVDNVKKCSEYINSTLD